MGCLYAQTELRVFIHTPTELRVLIHAPTELRVFIHDIYHVKINGLNTLRHRQNEGHFGK